MDLDPFAPLRLGFRITVAVLRFEKQLLERVLGLDRQDAVVVVVSDVETAVRRAAARDVRPPPADVAPPEPEAEVATVELEPEAATAEPEPPAHVDSEAELVAEFAERGAEEGAGAEVRVAEPWDGYRRMRVDEVRERVAVAGPEELAVIDLYENAHRKRRTVLEAVQRRSRELANAPSSR